MLKNQIYDNKDSYIRDQRLRVRPYINECITNKKNILIHNTYIFEVSPEEYNYQDNINIKLKNIGMGPMISLHVVGLKFFENEKIYTPIDTDFKSLEVGEIIELNTFFMNKTNYLMATIEIILEYNDILDSKYRQIVEIQLIRDKNDKLQKSQISSIHMQEVDSL